MTALPDGAAVEGEEDAIFDEPTVGEELEGLMGEPPSVSNESALALISKKHATTHPETIRDFIADTAARLAIESGCVDEAPLVIRGRITWRRNVRPTPVSSLRKVDLQVIHHSKKIACCAAYCCMVVCARKKVALYIRYCCGPLFLSSLPGMFLLDLFTRPMY
ncbi:unnamed protein product [Pylaiella littoralis]